MKRSSKNKLNKNVSPPKETTWAEKYLFKGFLWKYNIFVDDMFHKKHHLDGEDNFAISVGFMDKLVYKLKLGQTLYMHNPKLNYAMFDLYFLLMGAFQVLCTRATSNLLNS